MCQSLRLHYGPALAPVLPRLPTSGVRALLEGFLSSLEADGEALSHMQEGSHGCSLTFLLHNQATKWLSLVLWVVTELSPPWRALGQQQSSSAVEALLHTSCGSTHYVAPQSLSLSPEWAMLATGDLLLGGLF